MRKKSCIILIISMVVSSYGMAQKILMKIGSFTATGGEEVRALEFQINAATSYTQGGGVSVGKANPGSLMVKRTHNKSTSELFKKIVAGASFADVIFEYYDAGDKLYYTITLGNVFLTQVYWLSPECPTCLKLEQQLGFVFKTIKTTDAVTGVTLTWDVTLGTIL